MKWCFIFVCQQGELELKSLLLAASLKKYLRCDHELVAALPSPESTWGMPSTSTRTLLANLGARSIPIFNPIGFDYPIGNKLACLSIETDADKVVFLDSDMLCLRDFHEERRFAESALNAKPADLATFATDVRRWSLAYSACGTEIPAWRVRATVSGEEMPPYFNAGLVAANRNSGIGREWIDCARIIDADPAIPDKRPWLDQIALPVAMARLGIVPDCLDERFNYPAHLKPVSPGDVPWFVHYHTPEIVRAEPLCNRLVGELAGEHIELRESLEANPAWRPLLQPYVLSRHRRIRESGNAPLVQRSSAAVVDLPGAAPELIITGIPRSGTSYLCKVIHDVDDCVVINEPVEVFHPLMHQSVPWGLALFYRDLRREIRDGRPIANKLHNGQFIEDTAEVDTVERYVPEILRPDFLLGTKNTLAYLARLPQMRAAMPNARIVACVRNPFDTIASWKSTFKHLALADLEAQVAGNSRDAVLSEPQRERVREIAATASVAKRRALAWRHLAEIVLENREHLELVLYEDLVADPAAVLNRIFASTPHMFAAHCPAGAEATSPRRKRESLDPEDLAAIRAICGAAAGQLGYLDV